MDSTTHWFKDFSKFLITTIGVITGFLYFVIYQWVPIKELLVKHNLLSFTQNDLFIITPLAENKWYILGVMVVSFVLAVFLAFKTFPNDYSYFPWSMLSLWLISVLTIVYQLTGPVPWYGLAVGLFSLCFLMWLFLRITAGYLKAP